MVIAALYVLGLALRAAGKLTHLLLVVALIVAIDNLVTSQHSRR